MGTNAIDRNAKEELRDAIGSCGFSLVGFAGLELPNEVGSKVRHWLDLGYGAEMQWLADSVTDRLSPAARFPWAKSAVCVALAYDRPEPRPELGILRRISRYAQGRSYHNVIRKRLKRVGHVLMQFGASRHRGYCDTGPVLERQFAVMAGLGWVGKHSLLLNPNLGSMMFLATVFTDLEIVPDGPMTDHCGTCTACMDVCPTQAIVAPQVLDSRRCISYLNIEHRSAFSEPYDSELHGWIHGCDICQDVCPFVQSARRRERWGDPAFAPWATWQNLTLDGAAIISETAWSKSTLGSDLRRGGPTRLRRIALRLLKTSGNK